LPGLVDLVYNYPDQFPPCLLQTLHEYRPQCRLRINTFNLYSLHAPVIDPYELLLATSPCLYSIRCLHGEDNYIRFLYQEDGADADADADDSDSRTNYQAEAVMCLVAGLAPNLKEVHMYY